MTSARFAALSLQVVLYEAGAVSETGARGHTPFFAGLMFLLCASFDQYFDLWGFLEESPA